ncbi:MAG: hypothetical protein KGN36_03440 [Acidobacteriota bacterium]|nr:hypothetical protein [Acidobacteriota bacterium]
MNFLKALVILAAAAPASAQYGGPAVLTRGEAPAAMSTAQIDFRPFASITGVYDTGLNGVGVDTNGKTIDQAGRGIEGSVGISGLHSWRHTQVGLDFSFSARHYPTVPYYDGTNENLLLSVTQQLSRHVSLSVRTTGGMYTQNYGLPTLPQTVPFDPSTTYLPTNTFFDNRVIFLSTQADLVVQKSTRLSYSVGADGFLTRYGSSALYGMTGASARGDVQYRVSKRTTIGAGYTYTHFAFNHIFSSTDMHGFVGSYAVRLTKNWELTATGGATLFDTKFIQTVPVDPAIAILIGYNSTNQISYSRQWTPTGSGRLSYTMHRGVVYVSGGRAITPGNGLFLTSTTETAMAGYSYTGLKRWSAGISGGYFGSDSIGNYIGYYGSYMLSLDLSRQIMRYTHGILSVYAHKFTSGDFANYNLWAYGVRVGLGFTPGDIPMRLW